MSGVSVGSREVVPTKVVLSTHKAIDASSPLRPVTSYGEIAYGVEGRKFTRMVMPLKSGDKYGKGDWAMLPAPSSLMRDVSITSRCASLPSILYLLLC